MELSSAEKRRVQIRNLTLTAMFTAMVILLQLIGAVIKFGTFSVSLVLIPIAVGAAVCGPAAGAWLGFVFGLVVLLSGDAAWFLEYNAVGTVITVLCKGILCGLIPGLVYRAMGKCNRFVRGITAAILCPICNTGTFVIGCLIFFRGLVKTQEGFDGSVLLYVILAFVGLNFVLELLLNAVMSPVIVRLIDLAADYSANRRKK